VGGGGGFAASVRGPSGQSPTISRETRTKRTPGRNHARGAMVRKPAFPVWRMTEPRRRMLHSLGEALHYEFQTPPPPPHPPPPTPTPPHPQPPPPPSPTHLGVYVTDWRRVTKQQPRARQSSASILRPCVETDERRAVALLRPPRYAQKKTDSKVVSKAG